MLAVIRSCKSWNKFYKQGNMTSRGSIPQAQVQLRGDYDAWHLPEGPEHKIYWSNFDL